MYISHLKFISSNCWLTPSSSFTHSLPPFLLSFPLSSLSPSLIFSISHSSILPSFFLSSSFYLNAHKCPLSDFINHNFAYIVKRCWNHLFQWLLLPSLMVCVTPIRFIVPLKLEFSLILQEMGKGDRRTGVKQETHLGKPLHWNNSFWTEWALEF